MASQSKHFQFLKLKAYAEINGFELLETEWQGTKARHCFRHIESGESYESTPDNLFHKGFPKDLRTEHERSAESFLKLKQLAQDNGFELLEMQWLGVNVKHRFRHIESGKEREWAPAQLFSGGFPKDLRTDQDRFEEIKLLASDSGFELLESEWLGSHNKHRFRHIESGKSYEGTPSNVFRKGFPKDLRTPQERFEELKQLAQDNGYEFLETQWQGSKSMHRFRHIKSGTEHKWAPTDLFTRGFPRNIHSLPFASQDQLRKRSAESFQKLQQLAQDNGYELLEDQWRGANTKHRFRHIESDVECEWAPTQLFARGFPKDLRTDQDRFEQLKQLAKDNGFEVMEANWLGTDTKHRFRHLESGKEREWPPTQLFARGFPKDLRTDQDKLEQLRQLASDNGYELLEDQWQGSKSMHRFRHLESGKEREWPPTQLFRNGFPLADGQQYVTQEVIRQIFSHIFGGEFNTDRDRLKARNNGEPLELDGYEHFQVAPDALKRLTGHNNEGQEMAFNLSVAFEFQGHDNHRENDETIQRDKLKAELCRAEGIHLMQIDPVLKDESRFYRNVRDSGFMYAYVCKVISSHFGKDIPFPPGFKIDLSNWNPDKENFKKLQEFAENNGFELLETQWLGVATKHRFRHIESAKEREWVPSQLFCKGFPKDLHTKQERSAESFQKLQQLAQNNGFEFLETQWQGSKSMHRFRHIKSGTEHKWAPTDLFTRGFPNDLRTEQERSSESFQKLKQLAQDNGFELLETQWLGTKVKHRFRHIGSGKEYDGLPNHLFNSGFPKKFKRPPTPSPTPPQPQPQPDIPTTGPTANWFQLNDPSGAKLKLARIDGVPLMFIVDLSPLDPKSDECVELLGFHRVPNNSFLVRRVQEGERITEDSLRKVFPMVCEASMSCTELLIERPAPEPATSDLSISPQSQQQASRPAEPGLGQLMDHETEAHADLDETDEQEPDEQSFPVESCC